MFNDTCWGAAQCLCGSRPSSGAHRREVREHGPGARQQAPAPRPVDTGGQQGPRPAVPCCCLLSGQDDTRSRGSEPRALLPKGPRTKTKNMETTERNLETEEELSVRPGRNEKGRGVPRVSLGADLGEKELRASTASPRPLCNRGCGRSPGGGRFSFPELTRQFPRWGPQARGPGPFLGPFAVRARLPPSRRQLQVSRAAPGGLPYRADACDPLRTFPTTRSQLKSTPSTHTRAIPIREIRIL